MREVSVAGIGLFCPGGVGVEGAWGGRPGEVPGFRAQAYVVERKNLKLMSRAVKLGVSAIATALSWAEGWDEVPSERRGMFVGSTPIGGEMADLIPALETATTQDGQLDLGRFATHGYHLIHPLWLVKGLSNNVLGFASATYDFQGVNSNYCDGDASGGNALAEGWAAVAEGRAADACAPTSMPLTLTELAHRLLRGISMSLHRGHPPIQRVGLPQQTDHYPGLTSESLLGAERRNVNAVGESVGESVEVTDAIHEVARAVGDALDAPRVIGHRLH